MAQSRRYDDRRDLTVELVRAGGELRTTWHRPGLGPVASGPTRSWASVGTGFSFGGRHGPEAMAALLDADQIDALRRHLAGAGRTAIGALLFELIAPDEPLFNAVLRGVFEEHGPNPVYPPRHPVRLRIWTADPILLGLPWRLTGYSGRLLCDDGWTFEVSADAPAAGTPAADVEVRPPARLLCIAPEPVPDRPSLDTAAHVGELRAALERLSPSYRSELLFRVVRTRAELRAALGGMKPDFVYYYGHSELAGGEVHLLLGPPEGARGRPAPDPLSAADLRSLLATPPPRLVYLNGCFTGAAGHQSAGHQLCPPAAVVIGNRTQAFTTYARAFAVELLKRCIATADGADPVLVLHQLGRDFDRLDHQWATHTLHTAYRDWTAGAVLHNEPTPESALRLDRDAPRALVDKQVSELVSGKHRVEALIAWGAPRNKVDCFSWQALDYIEKRNTARVNRHDLVFPVERTDLRRRLEEELRLRLGASGTEPTAHVLARSAPQAGHGPAVVWLDWGCLGSGQRNKVKIGEVCEWLHFSSHLAHQCPPDVRVVSFLALEVDRKHHEALKERIDKVTIEIGSDRVRAMLLPALPSVELTDLVRFLSITTPGHTTCPPSLVREIAELILRTTGGEYHATVELIERAERIGWPTLADELRRTLERTAAAGPSEDIEL